MNTFSFNLLLADDDLDDCNFFKEALDDLPLTANLTIVNDGVQLMTHLASSADNLPDILFLDLNMPRKSGFDCLSEIKSNDKFRPLPVIIFSTSLDIEVVNLLYEKGAHYYIRKPGEYSKLKKAILDALTLTAQNNFMLPAREQFVLPT